MESQLHSVTNTLWFFAGLIVLLSCAFTVSNQTVKLIERFGKYNKTARAGLNFKIPFIDTVRTVLSIRKAATAMSFPLIPLPTDKVSVRISVAVNYQVVENKEHDAFLFAL